VNFRQRLALFLIVTLIGVQALTAVFAYGVVRHNLIAQGENELRASTAVFMRQLSLLSESTSDDVSVLSFDYALRKAVAEQDQQTALSALRNHGRRVGATRMMLVGLDGKITTDTTRLDMVGTQFPFMQLLNTAYTNEQGAGLTALDGGIYWTVAVPVNAPVPIAFIVACVPIDAAMLEKLRGISLMPHSMALATIAPDGDWSVVSQTGDALPRLPAASEVPAAGAVLATENGENLAMTARLDTVAESQPIIAILDYPLDQALATYRAVVTPMLIVLALALVAALAGAMLIARGVSRPLEALASAARRIAAGDYSFTPELSRRDEIGQLSAALSNMAQSIAERETALVGAVNSLEVARNEAVRASEAKSQFLSNMSHELRTPLNAIIGFSEMIKQQMLGPVGLPRYVEYAENIHQSGNHLLGQVQEMLDLAETSAGRMSIARERFSPGPLLRAALETLSPVAARAGVRVDVRDDLTKWPAVEGDSGKLQQGFKNLLHNAIKFTPEGGVVTVSGETARDQLTIRISDTGIGMPVEDIPLVVLPFHRRKRAFDGTHQGAGTGLPFAKAILDLHGGGLEIESAPGKGTTVIITLPLAAETGPQSIGRAA
jgi:signal transduction histidine kinase